MKNTFLIQDDEGDFKTYKSSKTNGICRLTIDDDNSGNMIQGYDVSWRYQSDNI